MGLAAEAHVAYQKSEIDYRSWLSKDKKILGVMFERIWPRGVNSQYYACADPAELCV